jgi:hypothetical protein
MGKKIWFSSLKLLKKEVGSGVGSGSISQRYGDPDTHQNVTDPQHFLNSRLFSRMGNSSYLILFLVHIVLGVQFEHVQDFFA